jgi:hypothetical protein
MRTRSIAMSLLLASVGVTDVKGTSKIRHDD